MPERFGFEKRGNGRRYKEKGREKAFHRIAAMTFYRNRRGVERTAVLSTDLYFSVIRFRFAVSGSRAFDGSDITGEYIIPSSDKRSPSLALRRKMHRSAVRQGLFFHYRPANAPSNKHTPTASAEDAPPRHPAGIASPLSGRLTRHPSTPRPSAEDAPLCHPAGIASPLSGRPTRHQTSTPRPLRRRMRRPAVRQSRSRSGIPPFRR